MKNLSLSKLAKSLYITIEKEHDALEDAKLLADVYSKIFNNNYDIEKIKYNLKLLNSLPMRLSREFIKDYQTCSNPRLSNDFKIIVIKHKINTRKEILNNEIENKNDYQEFIFNEKFEDVFQEIITKIYKSLELTVDIFDSNNNLIKSKKWHFEKEVVNDKKVMWEYPQELNDIIINNKDELFIAEDKNILISISSTINHRFIVYCIAKCRKRN